MLDGVRVHVNPVPGDIEDVRATVPVNPLTGATVIVDVPEAPALTVIEVGLAVMVKSTTFTVMLAVEWDSEPLVPVTVTV